MKNALEEKKKWLEAHAFDGLYCTQAPCGCLKDNPAPCGDGLGFCAPGVRKQVKATSKCGCDHQGTDHWHIVPKEQLYKCVNVE